MEEVKRELKESKGKMPAKKNKQHDMILNRTISSFTKYIIKNTDYNTEMDKRPAKNK